MEYEGGSVIARYVHGDDTDRPLVWYDGAGLAQPNWLHVDHLGSVIAVSDSSGALSGDPYRYSPYGEPEDGDYDRASRFRYTGQISLRDASLWHYKARSYAPNIGRFLQTDPVGYEDSLNLYTYVTIPTSGGADAFDLMGAQHKGVPTPHVQRLILNTNLKQDKLFSTRRGRKLGQ